MNKYRLELNISPMLTVILILPLHAVLRLEQ